MRKYCLSIQVWLEWAVGKKMDRSHTIKPTDNDIYMLTYALAIDSIMQYSSGQLSDFTTKNYILAEMESMIKKRKVTEFNKSIIIKLNWLPSDTKHKAIQSDNIPQNTFIVMFTAILWRYILTYYLDLK